jgi:Ca2+-transporting ATPase
MAIFVITIGLQIIIVQFGGTAFKTVPLNISQWCVSVGIGFLSIPLGVIIRLIPDICYSPPPPERVFMTKERLQWIGVISKVQTQLSVFRALRGSRRIQNNGWNRTHS